VMYPVCKFPKISSPIAAWRVLVERHVLPVAESRGKRYDGYLFDLMGPGVIATTLVWQPHIKALFLACIEKESAEEALAKAEAETVLRPGMTAAIQGQDRNHIKGAHQALPPLMAAGGCLSGGSPTKTVPIRAKLANRPATQSVSSVASSSCVHTSFSSSLNITTSPLG